MATNFCTGTRRGVRSETFANRTLAEELAGMHSQRVSDLTTRLVPPTKFSRRRNIILGVLGRISYAAFMQELSDEKLMRRYAKGDAKAFDQLYARHRGALYRYFNRQVGDAATVNDLYQGTWEKMIKARRKYRPATPFTAWLYRIAHNHLVDHYRRVKPSTAVETDELADKNPGPAGGAIDGEQKDLLRAGIIALPPEQRTTLLLKLESGLKMEEIASVTGVSRETVKSRLRYAVNKLKRSLVE
jgi:RNA polymerase sigma-70 factor (ECF subfamily)